MKTERNDPCPCGSGKKFKKCCSRVTTTAAPRRADVARAESVKADDSRLFDRLMRFARDRFGKSWLGLALDEYADPTSPDTVEEEIQLAAPWTVFHFPLPESDRSVAQVVFDRSDVPLPPTLHYLLAAQLESWLGIWEVQRVEPGVGMAMKDMLTHEERFVYEINASRTLSMRDALLGRVVDVEGVSFLAGIHPRSLAPRDADVAIREARRICRVRTRPVRPEQLRDPQVQLQLIDVWRALANRPVMPPTLTNTDGDPLVLTTDHFDVLADAERAVVARLATFPGAIEPEEGDDGSVVVTITKPGNATMKDWDNTIIGRVVIGDGRMRAESNSVQRADTLRSALTSYLDSLVTFRLRDETGAEQIIARARRAPPRSGAAV